MKHKRESSHSKNKLFVQIILAISLYSLFIVFGAVIAVAALNWLSQQEEETALYNGLLKTTAVYTDMSLRFLASDAKQLAVNQDVADLIYGSPARTDRILLLLMHTKNNNELVHGIVFYASAADLVLTSGNEEMPLEDSKYYDMILQYQKKQLPASEFFVDTYRVRVVQYDSKLWLVREFPLDMPSNLAVVFIEVDVDHLYRSISGEGGGYLRRLSVLDQNGTQLMGESQDNAGEILQSLLQTPENRHFDGDTYYYTQSEATGWYFLCGAREPSLFAQMADKSWSFVWVIVAVLLLSILLAAYFANTFVFPLQRLVAGMKSTQTFHPEDQNELSFLQKTIPAIIHSRNVLGKTMDELLPDVTGKFLQDLLRGRITSQDYAERMLAVTQLPFPDCGYYIVALVAAEESSAEENSTTIEWLLLTALQGLRSNVPDTGYYVQNLDSLHCTAVIAGLPTSFTAGQANLEWAHIRASLLVALHQQSTHLMWGEATVKGSITEVSFALEEAMLRLGPLPEVESSPDAAEKIGTYDYFYVRVNKALSLLSTEEKSEPLRILHACMDTIAQSSQAVDARLHMLSLLEQTVRDRLCEEISRRPEALMSPCYLCSDSLPPEENCRMYQDSLFEYCCEVVDFLANHHMKRRHKSLLAAENYIKRHAADPSLSLDMVADAVKINANYLSKLFNNNLDISFTDYLNDTRIKRVCEILSTTDCSVKHAASMAGFSSQQNFYRVFKKHMGVTPGQFKANDSPCPQR